MDAAPGGAARSFIAPQEAKNSINLLDLPEEILILIVTHLQPSSAYSTFPPRYPITASYTELSQSRPLIDDLAWPQASPQSLCSFVQVSRRTNQLGIPFLYNAITLQTISSTNRLSSTLSRDRQLGAYIRHLNLSNDGLLHGQSDRMADKAIWLASVGGILRSSRNLQSMSLSTRPGGEALQELFRHASSQNAGMQSLNRVTISSLSFSFPSLGASSLFAPNLGRLHLIQWIPPTLSERFGSTIFQSLQILRLSRIPSAIYRIAVEKDDQYYNSPSAQHIIDHSIRTLPQPLLLLLRECIEQYTNLNCIIMEFEQLADLDMPEGLRPWTKADQVAAETSSSDPSRQPTVTTSAITVGMTSTGGFGAPFDQYAAGHLGALASLDYPADIPLTLDESEQWPALLEENRCKERDRHWSRVLQFRNLILRYSKEYRKGSSTLSHLDIRIAAPRPMGWDRNDSLLDFHANARACQGDIDYSAFQDEDVFELVNQFPHLGHDFACDRLGNKVSYWTGALPRRAV